MGVIRRGLPSRKLAFNHGDGLARFDGCGAGHCTNDPQPKRDSASLLTEPLETWIGAGHGIPLFNFILSPPQPRPRPPLRMDPMGHHPLTIGADGILRRRRHDNGVVSGLQRHGPAAWVPTAAAWDPLLLVLSPAGWGRGLGRHTHTRSQAACSRITPTPGGIPAGAPA